MKSDRSPSRAFQVWQNRYANANPHDLASGEDAPEAVALLRQTLAAQPDGSVAIVQVGFFTNLSRLLESGADQYSPLSGADLVARKVERLVIMAGAFQTIRDNTRHLEYNVRMDIPSAQRFAENWTAPLVWSGFDDPGRQPLTGAYYVYVERR